MTSKTTTEADAVNRMTAKMASAVTSQYPTTFQVTPIFSDEELSEIFQIDFAEIFGSPDKPSKYSPKKNVSKGDGLMTFLRTFKRRPYDV